VALAEVMALVGAAVLGIKLVAEQLLFHPVGLEHLVLSSLNIKE